MSSSFTFTLTDKSSLIERDYFPPVELTENKDYELALLNFETFNSIPNIDETNNRFYYDDDKVIEIPTGSYEIKDIEEYLQSYLNRYTDSVHLTLRGNRTTLKSEILCNRIVDFTKPNNIGSILGFSNIILEPNKLYESNFPINIFKVNLIRIICNITTGAYSDEKLVHSIYDFSPNVPPGYKISILPTNLIYFPVTVRKITHLWFKICDQNDNLVNFRNEVITIKVHVRVKKNDYI